MAGTIIADTLTHSTAGSIATNYVVDGSAKAWVNFNGTGTIAARDSLNVSGLVDNSTGDYTVTLSNAMGNANYTISSNTSIDVGGYDGQQNAQPKANFSPTTALYKILTSNTISSAEVDAAKVHSNIHGDLA